MLLTEETNSQKTLTPSPRAADRRVPTTLWDLLVWVYARQKAHLDNGHVGGSGYASISATGAVLERMRLGVSVQGGGGGCGGSWGTACDDDALTVHGCVLRLGRHARTVIHTAAIAAMPDWRPYTPPLRVSAVMRGNGKPKMLYEHNRPIACILAYEGFPPDRAASWINHARNSYATWWAALSVLMEILADAWALKRWRVTGIGAKAEPWCE